MSVSPIRRLRLTVPLLAMVLAVGLLAGCAGQRAPSSYTDGVRDAFIEGCWTTLVSDANGLAAASTTKAPIQARPARDPIRHIRSATTLMATLARPTATTRPECRSAGRGFATRR